MKYLLISVTILTTISCNHQTKSSYIESGIEASTDTLDSDYMPDTIEPSYRDTLIGIFDGVHIDTLIAEPIGAKGDEDYDSGWYWNWRVYTTGGTVNELVLKGKTIGITFVHEGDLDGDGADEWGYVTVWPTSNWMMYNTFTYCDGYWSRLLSPTPIYLPHIYADADDAYFGGHRPEDLVSESTQKGFLNVKFSDVRNDGEDFLLIDTVMKIPAKEPLTIIE